MKVYSAILLLMLVSMVTAYNLRKKLALEKMERTQEDPELKWAEININDFKVWKRQPSHRN